MAGKGNLITSVLLLFLICDVSGFLCFARQDLGCDLENNDEYLDRWILGLGKSMLIASVCGTLLERLLA